RIVKRYVHEYLLVFAPLSQQKSGYEARMTAKIKNEVPFFKKFDNGWPIHEIARTYLILGPAQEKPSLFATDEEEEADDEAEVLLKAVVKKFPSKKRSTVILSDDDAESDDSSDLDMLLKPSAKLPQAPATPQEIPRRGRFENKTPEYSLKRKMDDKAEMPASKKAKLAPAKTLITPPPSTKKTSNAVLASLWQRSLACCTLPRILSLFQKRQNLLDEGGPRAKGLAFPTFNQLLLFPFIKSNTHHEFLNAIKHKTCGYYGLQGQMIMFSCLLRFVAENEDEHDLENALFSTMFTIIGDDEDDQFDDLHTLYEDSCCLRMKDFVDFVLVPFVATFLISQDLPTQDASFEKESSTEYGELVNPEDDADEEASHVHEENVRAVRRVERARENPLIPVSAIESTAPPCHRKKSEKKEEASLKIRLPAQRTLEEEEITLSDYEAPQPKLKKERVKPEKKDKVKQKASKKATGQSTIKTSHLTIKTRSHAKGEGNKYLCSFGLAARVIVSIELYF
ncbi:hypothetical protein K438DRAFT_1813199, partial [Mycena galopus ATCC 62051]